MVKTLSILLTSCRSVSCSDSVQYCVHVVQYATYTVSRDLRTPVVAFRSWPPDLVCSSKRHGCAIVYHGSANGRAIAFVPLGRQNEPCPNTRVSLQSNWIFFCREMERINRALEISQLRSTIRRICQGEMGLFCSLFLSLVRHSRHARLLSLRSSLQYLRPCHWSMKVVSYSGKLCR